MYIYTLFKDLSKLLKIKKSETIFGLKVTVKSGLEKMFLELLHAEAIFF